MSSQSNTNTKTFDVKDLTVQKVICKSKYSIYKAASKETNQEYALKIFPYRHGKINADYLHELQTQDIQHKNIIRIVAKQDSQTIEKKGKIEMASCILMEYAPFGDFFNFMNTFDLSSNEKLLRSYFYQLIEAVEYLHDNQIAHLDIKLENVVLGANYFLKLIDFDLSYRCDSNEPIKVKGTANYRAPELKAQTTSNPYACDVFSAGVFLFVLKAGILPFLEDSEDSDAMNLYKKLQENPKEFWATHGAYQQGKDVFSQEFKDLFQGMTEQDPEERLTIEEVKNSDWYQGPVYNKFELSELVSRAFKETSLE
mmetsp:Transcript_30872/g.28060  ORF Transcript_30872/g.28060 Transcript_30872/m.28060 type:complete len:312 (-) Transcript_30872:45-980(-)|eukprot:CAMPEP_0114590138 /NCGR_PEP_ID=MMETSP0125-20121206/12437_1 /TAXON_ID=485358 ORGANISM="Aristerostoma sp., Strain ATCC 50986" /NCGR_SAMPLE_ID=MMETSP0125 /ASSEMBLY_ACC=CAM_ASM_000245 /LENGTH=311 /DNA_ID=CAMNT_0001787427 /DNA_START=51 /DNA_END=986 /DNA_ORIENTATION=+